MNTNTNTGTAIHIRTFGTPGPQGSKRHVGNGIMVESSSKVAPWREAVVASAREQVDVEKGHPFGTDAVAIEITFLLQRPKGHYGSGPNAGKVRPSARRYPCVKPDVDKLVRSTLDALKTGGVLSDDSQVVMLYAIKLYAPVPTLAGAIIDIRYAE